MNDLNLLRTYLYSCTDDQLRKTVGAEHERARDAFPNNHRKVETYADFSDGAGEYYAYHHGLCVAPGATMIATEAIGRARDTLIDSYVQRKESLDHAYRDAKERGMRRIYDILADHFRFDAFRRYRRALLDRLVPPNDYDAKVEFIREMFEWNPDQFRGFDVSRPQRYASDYDWLSQKLIDNLNTFAREARRL